ncbi:MAG: hypothetical protein K0S33_497 [Bacteroidetes bacterium]|nr:hypothetical protein [Bacteroidota bacterium]
MNIEQFIISSDNIDSEKLLNAWKWLIGKDKEILVITKMGDLVLKNKEGHLFFLNTEDGSLEHLSNFYSDFYKNKLSPKQYLEIFKPDLLEDMMEDEKFLEDTEVYGYKTLPVLGGKTHPSNMFPVDIYKHFMATAYVHEQLDTIDPPIESEQDM